LAIPAAAGEDTNQKIEVRMTRKTTLRQSVMIAVGLLIAGMAGCAGEPTGDEIVAEIGDRTIALREVTDYVVSLNVDYTDAEDEYQARRSFLDRLIVDELLIVGAYARELDADIGILELVDGEKDKFLMDELYRTQVLDQIEVPESDIRRAYDNAFKRVRFRHIQTATRAGCDSAMTELRAGGDFGDLAEKYSIDNSTRLRGGDLGRTFRWGELPEALQQAAFDLPIGELGGPIESTFGWHLLTVTERTEDEKTDYDEARPNLERRLRRQLQDVRRADHLEQLREGSAIEFNATVLELWRTKLQEIVDTADLPVGRSPRLPVESLSEDEKARIVFRFPPDHEVTFEIFCRALQSRSPFEQPDPSDPEDMVMFAFGMSLHDILYDEALRLNLDESEIYKRRVQEHQEALMAERMRTSVLVNTIRVTEDEVRAFYDVRVDSFISPAQYQVREVMRYDSTSAGSLLRRVRAGLSMEEVARTSTQRPGFTNKAGDLGWLTPSAYPEFYQAATKMKIGEVSDVLPAVGQYSFIEVIDSRPAEQLQFEDVHDVIYDRLLRRRRDAAISTYLDSVKVTNPVTIHENVMRRGLGEGTGVPRDRKIGS
jgi:parvulin-like peptidyl-prolyl isomerase